jgi:hypothetical protein
MIPTFGSPASSSSSSVSGIVVTSVSASRSEAWIGSSPSRTPASSAAAAIRRRPSIDELARLLVALAGRPVRQRTQSGSKRAKRRTDAQSDSIRVSTSSGPSITVFGRIDGTSGTQFVTLRPHWHARGLEVGLVVRAELHFPDPDPAESRSRIRAKIVAEACEAGRDLTQREHQATPGSFARSRRRRGGRMRCLATM